MYLLHFPTDHPTTDTIPAAIQNAIKQSISVNSLTSGAVEAVYRSPNRGRVILNLLNSRKDILIHIDARFHWLSDFDTLVLNSKTAKGQWQKEVRPKGFPFPCCDYITAITLRVEISETAFVISANGIEIVKYPYRNGLVPPVSEIEYIFVDDRASKKAKLESLSVDY